MKNYILKNNETVLFKSEAKICLKNKKYLDVDILLTNLNFVFIYKKKFFSAPIENEVFDIKTVKIYDSSYQIIRKNKLVDLYLIGAEKTIEFPNLKLAKEFADVALKLVSGYSKFVRGVKRVQKTVDETEVALNIDIGQALKTTAVTVGNIAIEASGLPIAGNKTKIIGAIAKSLIQPNNKQQNQLLDKSTNNMEN